MPTFEREVNKEVQGHSLGVRREPVIFSIPAWGSGFHRGSDVCISQQFWSKVGSAHPLPFVVSLKGGRTSCQNCVPSLPGRQAPCLCDPRAPTFSFPSMRLLGKFQFLEVYCLSSLVCKGSGTLSFFMISLFLPRLLCHVSSFSFCPGAFAVSQALRPSHGLLYWCFLAWSVLYPSLCRAYVFSSFRFGWNIIIGCYLMNVRACVCVWFCVPAHAYVETGGQSWMLILRSCSLCFMWQRSGACCLA